MSRKPFPQLNPFREWVVEELRDRKTTWPTPISTPITRMTSCNEDSENRYKYFTMGLQGFDVGPTNLFDLTYGAKKDIVGYGYRTVDGKNQKTLIGADEINYISPQLKEFNNLSVQDIGKIAVNQRIKQAEQQQSQVVAAGAMPIPAITSISIKRSGLAAPLIADVKWQCYNQQQLEFLRNHFLVIGSYVVLEWGQQTSHRQINKMLDFTDPDIDQELLNTVVLGRKFVIDNYSEPNNGNYDFIVAQVGNFNFDYEPHTNIYRCRTHLVSMGENVWGTNTSTTFTNQTAAPTNQQSNRLNSIHDYFGGQTGGYGTRFDQLLGQLSSNPSKFIRPAANAFKQSATTILGVSAITPNPTDNSFISWSALTEDVLNDFNEMFNNVSNDPELQTMLDTFRKEMRTLLGLGGPPSKLLRTEIYEQQQEMYEKEWIGNHKFLRSTDPDSMILITPELAKLGPAADWLNGGIFGSPGGEDRGKLTTGIWLNSEMVKECFLKTTTLEAAFREILNRMNNSVAGYWQLQLFYDDEINVYKVIDYKFDSVTAPETKNVSTLTSGTTEPEENTDVKFYVFNSNRNNHHNEVVEINFDSAFPPELITQMMVVSMIQTSTPEEQEQLFKRYPLINNTSPFMFAVNWTSLKDTLKHKIQAYRNGHNIQSGVNPSVTPSGQGTGQTKVITSTSRVTDASLTPVDNTSFTTVANSAPAIDTTVAKPRTTPFVTDSIANKNVLKLESYPLDSLIITSRLGAREAPTSGASTNHKGLDLRAITGTPVKAVKSGVVELATEGIIGYGTAVYIKHSDGFESRYGHLSKLNVTAGTKVKGGQVIGFTGNTGTSSGPHLHFEMRKDGVIVNPEDSLRTVGPLQYKQIDGSISDIAPSDVMIGSGNTPTVPNVPLQYPSSDSTRSSVTPVIQSSSKNQSPKELTETPSSTTSTYSEDVEKYMKEVQQKFGEGIRSLIAPSTSMLRNWITQDGYSKIGKRIINGFVTPFPTKTSVEVKIPGIAGLSISDGFMVDKLPMIFSQYGVFQVIEITDNVSEQGWYTTVKGYFKLLWPDGRGGGRVD
jgi:murein DD-endopeptidase MepM/ murein hydrolase activator NlpD